MQRILRVLNLFGPLLAGFAATLLAPLLVAVVQGDGAASEFLTAGAGGIAAGLLIWRATQRYRGDLQPRDAFLLVSMVWTVLPALATVPLLLWFSGGSAGLTFTDAYFEAVSGLTTTGATTLTGLDALPPSINFWRCLLQWLGGMGILVLAVAILPLVGAGGADLLRAETTGPMKENKLAPRMAVTARILWTVYCVISVLCLLAYRMGGMSWLDAAMHMFTTLSLGGLSSHDASFAWFDSPALEWTAVLFMLAASCNFALYYTAVRARSFGALLLSSETKGTLTVMIGGSAVVAALLLWNGVYDDGATALRLAAFNVVSVASTTGYATADYEKWPIFAPVLMILLSSFATSSGSTGAGIKMMRFIILTKQAAREMTRMQHPRAVVPLRLGTTIVADKVVFSILAFMLIYGATVLGCSMLLLFTGMSPTSAFSATLASVNNLGPGLEQVGPSQNFASLTDLQTWICIFAMLLGRLEMFSLLVLFTPGFWRR